MHAREGARLFQFEKGARGGADKVLRARECLSYAALAGQARGRGGRGGAAWQQRTRTAWKRFWWKLRRHPSVSSLHRKRLQRSMYSIGLILASFASGNQASFSPRARMSSSVFRSRCARPGMSRGTAGPAVSRAARARASRRSMSTSTPECG